MNALDCIIEKHPLPWKLDKALTGSALLDANRTVVLEASPGEDPEIFAMYATALTEGAALSVKVPNLERAIALKGDAVNELHAWGLKVRAERIATAAARDSYKEQLVAADAATIARGAARAHYDPIFARVRAWVQTHPWDLAACELAMREYDTGADDLDHQADVLMEFDAGARAVSK